MVGAGAIKEACGWVDIVHDHHHYPSVCQMPPRPPNPKGLPH